MADSPLPGIGQELEVIDIAIRLGRGVSFFGPRNPAAALKPYKETDLERARKREHDKSHYSHGVIPDQGLHQSPAGRARHRFHE
jgi:hypothetical protein